MKKIIIIDDDNHIRLLIKEILEELDEVDINEAESAEAGLELIKKIKPDLIFLDVSLPKMNGYDLVKLLKTSEEFKNLKIFIITAKAQEKEINFGMSLGVEMYITKPFDPDFLLINACEYLEIDIE